MRGLELGSLIVLLWMLSEKQVGLAALSWTVAVILEAYNGLGIGTALVQASTLSRKQLDSAFWFATGIGALLLLISAALSPFLASYFGEPALAPMVIVASTNILWTGIAAVPLQLLHRELRFKEAALIETAAVGLASLTKIAAAALGLGAWSLVIGHTAEGFFLLVGVNVVAPFRPRLAFVFHEIRALVVFGLKVATSRIIYHGYRNLDYMVVGKAFGTEALGVYRVGFEIAMSPAMSVLNVLNGAAFPVYSRLAADRARLKESFVWTTRNLVVLIGPIAVFLAFAAPNLVPLVGGEKWLPAVPVVQVLCWAALLRCVAHLTPQLLHAAGRPDLAIYDSLITLCMLAVSFAVFLGLPMLKPWGIMGIAWGWLLAYPPILLALWVFARRVVPLGFGEYLASFRAGALATTSVALSLLVCSFVPQLALPATARLGLQLVVAVLTLSAFVRFGLGVKLQTIVRGPRGEQEA